jgi:uncharacterized pyridoxal phosphate-containing UPF0001 family protein
VYIHVTVSIIYVQKLVWCREVLCQQLNCAELELSMGMTDDYQHAIELGSTSVRIGRAIFSPDL